VPKRLRIIGAEGRGSEKARSRVTRAPGPVLVASLIERLSPSSALVTSTRTGPEAKVGRASILEAPRRRRRRSRAPGPPGCRRPTSWEKATPSDGRRGRAVVDADRQGRPGERLRRWRRDPREAPVTSAQPTVGRHGASRPRPWSRPWSCGRPPHSTVPRPSEAGVERRKDSTRIPLRSSPSSGSERGDRDAGRRGVAVFGEAVDDRSAGRTSAANAERTASWLVDRRRGRSPRGQAPRRDDLLKSWRSSRRRGPETWRGSPSETAVVLVGLDAGQHGAVGAQCDRSRSRPATGTTHRGAGPSPKRPAVRRWCSR